MSILIDRTTKVIIQGITGQHGSFHTKLMLSYGTKIVAGVTPGKGGERIEGVPVYDNVSHAVAKHGASWSILFVPAMQTLTAGLEALQSGLNLVVITEHMPVFDAIKLVEVAEDKGLHVIGPNCPGLIIPDETKIGIMPGHIFKRGEVGIVSRSGTLTYEIVSELSRAGIGQSAVVGIGGDRVIGTTFMEILEMFEQDEETEKIVLVGEIGGNLEERAAKYIHDKVRKPVVAYIAGHNAPEGRTMGHAGAVISGTRGTAKGKTKALEEVGVKVAKLPSEVVELVGGRCE